MLGFRVQVRGWAGASNNFVLIRRTVHFTPEEHANLSRGILEYNYRVNESNDIENFSAPNLETLFFPAESFTRLPTNDQKCKLILTIIFCIIFTIIFFILLKLQRMERMRALACLGGKRRGFDLSPVL